MSRGGFRSRLVGLADTDLEDDVLAADDSAAPSGAQRATKGRASLKAQSKDRKPLSGEMAAARKKTGKVAAEVAASSRVTKPPAKSRSNALRISGRLAAADGKTGKAEEAANEPQGKKASGRGRGHKAATATEEAGEFYGEAPNKTAARLAKARGRPKTGEVQEQKEEEGEESYPELVHRGAGRGKRAGSGPKKTLPEKGRIAKGRAQSEDADDTIEIPETQTEPSHEAPCDTMDLDEEEDLDDPDEVEMSIPGHFPADSPRRNPATWARRADPSLPLGYHQDPPFDGGGDPALRRRLGEITRKCVGLEQRYRDLREIGIKEAERNFDKFRKQSEKRSAAAEFLINSLKAELAIQKESAREALRLQNRVDTSEAKASKLQVELDKLKSSLSESRTEVKALTMKLAASRTAEVAAAAKIDRQVPGSAMKFRGGPMSGSSAAATEIAQLKEDLYADLTGLIVRSVKHEGSDEVYDCIQTGKNGTLHFKLAIRIDQGKTDYNEAAEFRYTPLLDPGRDRALIDLLPDFLVEEIQFPRPHAAKFYARVTKAMTLPPE